jgi:hypothetical protein
MAYRFQFRGDIESNWTNIILAEREIGILQKNENGKIVNTNLYKIGDGKTAWKDLPYFGFNGTLSESLIIGENEQTQNEAVSKKALVEKFGEIIEAYEAADTALGGRIDGVVTNYEAADTALGGRIDGVVTNYEAADAALGGRIDGVVTNYEAADAALDGRITKLEESHVIMSETNWNPETAEENTFYYIYEETKD